MSKGDKKVSEKGKREAPVTETTVNDSQASTETIEYDDQASIETTEYDDQASMGEEEDRHEALTEEMIEAELEKERHRHNYIKALRSAVYVLIIVAAATSIVVVLLLPVLQITGNSMSETLQDGDIVLAAKSTSYQPGDVVAFYYNNNILVKRVIATAGDWVDIDEDGNVSINGEAIDEPYITDKALGYCNVDFPYQVPDGRSFLMGDNRETSMDSRNTEIGCVDDNMVLGKIKFCIWPFSDFGIVK